MWTLICVSFLTGPPSVFVCQAGLGFVLTSRFWSSTTTIALLSPISTVVSTTSGRRRLSMCHVPRS
ncbi:hypothetical protein FPV67DRAFT_1483195, partial [Lyophyllum atratum]